MPIFVMTPIKLPSAHRAVCVDHLVPDVVGSVDGCRDGAFCTAHNLCRGIGNLSISLVMELTCCIRTVGELSHQILHAETQKVMTRSFYVALMRHNATKERVPVSLCQDMS